MPDVTASNKPFCDGTHKRVAFDGPLTAMQAGT
jgi:CDGSH-type Zn-finger protein